MQAGEPAAPAACSPGSPALEVGHLHTGAVHTVGGLHERHQDDGAQLRVEAHPVDLVSHGIDPLSVGGLEEAALYAVGLGEPPGTRGNAPQVGEGQLHLGGAVCIGLDVGPGQGGGVGVVVVGGHLEPSTLEGKPDPGGAAEQVDDVPNPGQLVDQCRDAGNQPAL